MSSKKSGFCQYIIVRPSGVDKVVYIQRYCTKEKGFKFLRAVTSLAWNVAC